MACDILDAMPLLRVTNTYIDAQKGKTFNNTNQHILMKEEYEKLDLYHRYVLLFQEYLGPKLFMKLIEAPMVRDTEVYNKLKIHNFKGKLINRITKFVKWAHNQIYNGRLDVVKQYEMADGLMVIWLERMKKGNNPSFKNLFKLITLERLLEKSHIASIMNAGNGKDYTIPSQVFEDMKDGRMTAVLTKQKDIKDTNMRKIVTVNSQEQLDVMELRDNLSLVKLKKGKFDQIGDQYFDFVVYDDENPWDPNLDLNYTEIWNLKWTCINYENLSGYPTFFNFVCSITDITYGAVMTENSTAGVIESVPAMNKKIDEIYGNKVTFTQGNNIEYNVIVYHKDKFTPTHYEKGNEDKSDYELFRTYLVSASEMYPDKSLTLLPNLRIIKEETVRTFIQWRKGVDTRYVDLLEDGIKQFGIMTMFVNGMKGMGKSYFFKNGVEYMPNVFVVDSDDYGRFITEFGNIENDVLECITTFYDNYEVYSKVRSIFEIMMDNELRKYFPKDGTHMQKKLAMAEIFVNFGNKYRSLAMDEKLGMRAFQQALIEYLRIKYDNIKLILFFTHASQEFANYEPPNLWVGLKTYFNTKLNTLAERHDADVQLALGDFYDDITDHIYDRFTLYNLDVLLRSVAALQV